MLINHKLRAFTLVELLVVMVLSSIMVGIVYFTYYTVTTYHFKLIQKQRAAEDISSLYFLLKKDAAKCRRIVANHPMSVSFLEDHDKHVDYFFDSLYVLRVQETRTDTFRCLTENPSYRFAQNKITTFPETVDALQVEVTDMGAPVNIHILKEYDAASLINITRKDTLP